MKTAARKKEKTEAELMERATDRLLKAVKQRMLKKDGRVDYAKLRREGYSERILAKLEAA